MILTSIVPYLSIILTFITLLYSQKHQFLFTHISRTGGVSVSRYLSQHVNDLEELLWQHAPLAMAKDKLGKRFDQLYKFAFVRNPWNRFVSWYALIGQTIPSQEMTSKPISSPNHPHWEKFDAFLDDWSSEKIQVGDMEHPKLSQWGQLVGKEGSLLTDDIGRFESFKKDAAFIFKNLGISPDELPHINASSHHHYSDYYTNYGKELVQSVFKDDIQQFNYQFEKPSALST